MSITVGFHAGVGGNRTGIGVYMATLDSRGIPFAVKSVKDEGLIAEALRFTGAPHHIIYRDTNPGGAASDLPNYDLPPAQAAYEHWQRVRDALPGAVVTARHRVWVETCNEPDKNRLEWLAQYALAYCKLALADGFRVIPFSLNAGEPEPEQWLAPHMRALLSYIGDKRSHIALGLHDAKIGDISAPLSAFTPWLVGRDLFLKQACDQLGLPYPTVYNTEWAWSYNDLPEAEAVRRDLRDLMTLHQGQGLVQAAFLFTLHGGQEWGSLPDQLQARLNDVTDIVLAHYQPPPPPPDDTVWYKSIPVLLPQNATHNEAIKVFDAGYPDRRTFVFSHDDAIRLVKGAAEGSRVIIYDLHRWPQEVQQLLTAVPHELRQLAPPPPSFSFRAWPTDYVAINQEFGANPAFYREFGLPGHEGVDIMALMNTPIYAVEDGEVYLVAEDEEHPYGTQIRLEHVNGWKTVYAHLSQILVRQGQHVRAGERIGLADSTGNSTGSHLHLTLKREGHTYIDEHGVWPSNIHDPTPFLAPLMDQVAPPLYDMLAYMRGNGVHYELAYTWDGGGTHPIQTINMPMGVWRIAKGHNGEFEELYHDQHYIYRSIDTSVGGGRYYIQRTAGVPGAIWCDRYLRVGQTTVKQPHVTHYDNQCRVIAEGAPHDTLTLKAHYDSYTFPSGVALDDVVYLEWNQGEGYYFARSFGLVGFRFSGGQSYIAAIHEGRPNLVPSPPPCVALGNNRYYAP